MDHKLLMLLIQDFAQVATLAGQRLDPSSIEVQMLTAPHRPPSRLPVGKMAVYVFRYKDAVLKVGKAGPKSAARYIRVVAQQGPISS
jgi:predicted dehydrogenase